jgi:hypothetical protein
MTFSMAEMFLLVWAIGVTVAYGVLHCKYHMLGRMTFDALEGVAKGKLKVIETEDGFDFKEV